MNNTKISKMSIEVIGGGVYLKNKPQTITIAWNIKDENGNIIIPDKLTVNNITLNPTDTSKTYNRVFSDVNFTVKAEKDGIVAIGTTTARFVGPTQTVEDSLDSNSKSIALSANAGKILNEKIDNVSNSFKGLFTTFDELKKKLRSGKNGDWAIVGEGIPAPIYVWKNNGWEASGGNYEGDTVELNNYYNKGKVAEYTDDYNVSKNHKQIIKIYDENNWLAITYNSKAPVFRFGDSYDSGEIVNMTGDKAHSYKAINSTNTAPYVSQESSSFTLEQAISHLPEDLRVTGQKISFYSSELNAWMTYVFTGGDYENPTYWEIFTNNINPDTDKHIEELYETVDDLQNQITNDVNNLNSHITEANNKFDTIDNTLEEHEDRMDNIEDEILMSSVEAACAPKDVEILADRAYKDHKGKIIADEYITREGLTNEIIDITNQQVTDLKPGSVQPEDLSDAVKQLIGNKNVTNLPDEEDITTIDNTLKFKDKEYSPKDYSGMGRKRLRKHYINGVNILTQHMINKPNTIYIIEYDYCLGGETIEIPENCVLQFEGGSLRNGEVVGNKTCIKSCIYKIFDLNINLNGKWNIDYIYPEWFGALGNKQNDSTAFIQKSIYISSNISVPVKLVSNNYYITKSIYFPSYAKIEGNVRGAYKQNLEPTIIANFGEFNNINTFAWIFDTDNISSDTGERLKYNDIKPENSINENIYYNACSNISIKNIRIYSENKIFGGIRLFGSPNSNIENIYIQGTKIAIGIFVSWAVSIRDVVSSTYLCGAFINECQAIEFDNVYMDGYRTTDSNGKYIINYNVTNEDYFDDFITFDKNANTRNLETYIENYKHGNGLIGVDCRNLLLNQCLFEHWATGINLNRVYQTAINNYYLEDIWYIGIRANQSTIGINGAYQVGDSNKVPNNIIYLFDFGVGTHCSLMGYRFRSPGTWNTNIYTPSKDSSLYDNRGDLIILGNGYREYDNWIKGNQGVTFYDDINSMFVDRNNNGFLSSKDYINIPQIYENGTNGIFYYKVASCEKGKRINSFVSGTLRNGDSFFANISVYNSTNDGVKCNCIITTSYNTPESVKDFPKAYYIEDTKDSNIVNIFLLVDSGCNIYVIGNTNKQQLATIDTKNQINAKYLYTEDLFKKVGDTSERPVGKLGRMFYDTTLNKPIWWNGTNWIDATGAEV